jgi:ubiquinone/menaquinone biosynthesis C-methylase UbiE
METRPEVDRLNRVYRFYRDRALPHTRWSAANAGNQAIRAERLQTLERLLEWAAFLPLTDARLLEVGCGTGGNFEGFLRLGVRPAHLVGVDLLAERIEQARQAHPDIALHTVNAESLPFADASFDLVAVFTVFSSILDRQMRHHVRREIDRVLRFGGGVIWYDFRWNNPFNPHVRGISRRDLRDLFPRFEPRLTSLTLLPPLARRLGGWTPRLYRPLAALPFLRTHLLGILIKR